MPSSVATNIKDQRLEPFRQRDDATRFRVEGADMIRQALGEGWTPLATLFRDPLASSLQPLYRDCAAGGPATLASRGVFFKVLGLGYETATDALALFTVPPHGETVLRDLSPRALCLVGVDIQDPRNVGVLVRTADALGADALALTGDAAWPWSRQSLRSTTGSIFRVPIHMAASAESLLGDLRAQGFLLVGSSAQAAQSLDHAAFRLPCAVVLGNETLGLGAREMALCDLVVRIPMRGGAHSLNVTVAAGILLHAVARAIR